MTSQESAVLRGTATGDIDDIDPQLYDESQNTGIVTLFSVSDCILAFSFAFQLANVLCW